MVWEASQKGVPFLGVPGNSLNNRGWENQPNNRVLYTNYKDSY